MLDDHRMARAPRGADALCFAAKRLNVDDGEHSIVQPREANRGVPSVWHPGEPNAFDGEHRVPPAPRRADLRVFRFQAFETLMMHGERSIVPAPREADCAICGAFAALAFWANGTISMGEHRMAPPSNGPRNNCETQN
ncbi:MAG: hypothetical protein QM831_26310 [Kofleriaceae bacterium]